MLDRANPRIPSTVVRDSDEGPFLSAVFNALDVVTIARSIAMRGFSKRPADALGVVRDSDRNSVVVVDGNRRLAAVRMLDPYLTPAHLAWRARNIEWRQMRALAAAASVRHLSVVIHEGSRDDIARAAWMTARHIVRDIREGRSAWLAAMRAGVTMHDLPAFLALAASGESLAEAVQLSSGSARYFPEGDIRSGGTVPVKSLPAISRTARFAIIAEAAGGMEPDRLLLPRFNDHHSLVRLPSSGGMEPDSLLLPSPSDSRLVRLPSSGGIEPDSLLLSSHCRSSPREVAESGRDGTRQGVGVKPQRP